MRSLTGGSARAKFRFYPASGTSNAQIWGICRDGSGSQCSMTGRLAVLVLAVLRTCSYCVPAAGRRDGPTWSSRNTASTARLGLSLPSPGMYEYKYMPTQSVLSKMRHLVKPIRWPRPHPRPTKERPFDERVNLGTFQRDRPPSHRRGNPFVPVPFLPKNRASPSQGRRRSGRVHIDGRFSPPCFVCANLLCWRLRGQGTGTRAGRRAAGFQR
jgi:hypothetical protein